MRIPQVTVQDLRAVLSRHRRAFIVLGSFLAAFVVMNYIVMPLYVQHGKALQVPAVVGMTLERARYSLDSAVMQAVEAETRPDPEYPAGSVINQNPEPGATVKQGRRVYLTVSGGEVEVLVPSLRGRTLRDARFALERNGLRLGGTSYSASSSFPENTIVDQTVPPNGRVSRGTPIGIVVSSGVDTLKISVPALGGKSTTEAERILLGSGLKVGNITLQPSFDLLPNTIVGQFPRAGEFVARGQAVDLFVVRAGRPSEEIHDKQP
jgi:beta-lactam-binding protein with PASTA domain